MTVSLVVTGCSGSDPASDSDAVSDAGVDAPAVDVGDGGRLNDAAADTVADADSLGDVAGDVESDAPDSGDGEADDFGEVDGGDVGDDVEVGSGDPCPCPTGDCSASDGLACDDGGGLCGGGRCHDSGVVEAELGHGDGYWVADVAVSADGARVGAAFERPHPGSEAPVVRIWSVADPSVGRAFEGAVALAFDPIEADRVAIAFDDRVEVWRLDDEALPVVIERAGGRLAFSPDGAWLAIASEFGAHIYNLLDPTDPALDVEHPLIRDARLWVLEFSPDGRRVAVGRGVSSFGSPAGDLRIFDAESGERVALFDCPVISGSFSPDSERFAAACWSRIAIYDIDAQTTVYAAAAAELALGLRYLPDDGRGERLLYGTFVGETRVLRGVGDAWRTESAIRLPSIRWGVELPNGDLILAPWAERPVERWTPTPRTED